MHLHFITEFVTFIAMSFKMCFALFEYDWIFILIETSNYGNNGLEQSLKNC